MRFPLERDCRKKIHGLRAFLPIGLYLEEALYWSSCLAAGVPIGFAIVVPGADFHAGRRVSLSGRLDFTEGPPIAVK
jgi:hypothetical protein